MCTYAKIKSPRLQYAAIALAAVEKPYEYTTDASICIYLANRSSSSKCTSKQPN